MFENLTGRLSEAARNLSGKGRLTESNIKDTLRQVRLALLEADVALPVVKTFIERIREQARRRGSLEEPYPRAGARQNHSCRAGRYPWE